MKTLPYETATSGERALGEIEKMLQGFGCESFGSMMNYAEGVRFVQFEYRGREVRVKASAKGYAAAWLRLHPYKASGYGKTRVTLAKHQEKALAIGAVATCSILRDWIKGQFMAIETGVLSFEGAFLGQILLASGKTVLEHAESQKLLGVAE
jgi:hypothetical protein